METEENSPNGKQKSDETEEDDDPIELVLFHVPECYVYIIPPRKTAASYRADEWDVNKWAWEGVLKVISKGEECIIRLEDKSTGELYARAFLRKEEQHPVEPVIDSSRYFVLRIEENIGGRLRHAFIGIGFRERTEAYDFQAALHDHMKYLDKKKTAEEMEYQFQNSSTVDYSLKDGETLVLQLKNKPGGNIKLKSIDQCVNNLSITEKSKPMEPALTIKPPPPPPATLSPTSSPKTPRSPKFYPDKNFEAPPPPPVTLSPTTSPKTPRSPKSNPDKNFEVEKEDASKEQPQPNLKAKDSQSSEDVTDDDFGDFQAAD